MREEAAKLNDAPVAYRVEEYQSPFAPLIDELYRERVLRARRTPPEEKFLAGEELFEYACSITLAGIKHQNPGFTEADCRRELERRLALRERMELQERMGRQG
jgi:hypothetical protein